MIPVKNQSGFQPERSTADVIWTHRWLAAKALKEETTIKISGIDMSAAFDTINRRHLLDIVKLIIDTLGKVLSLITLDRIRPSIEKYLSHSQSGFRPERSTSDVVWTHIWLAAKTVAENINIKITGIDMSAAFDTIDRDILLQILKNIVEEDELRLIQFLLSNTHINTRINNADINAPFTNNVGTPQGDGLSPVLFTIYLEHALKEVRTVISEPKSPLQEKIPGEIAYDVDFVGLGYIDIDAVQRTLHRYNLKVNIDKT